MNLLAIPNDATSAYYRNPEDDFLSEFNPKSLDGQRFFNQVYFLNWKDEKDEEYCGIKSISVLSKKKEALKLVKDLGKHKKNFSYPLFTDFFKEDLDNITLHAREANASIIRAFNANHAAELGILMKEKLNLPLVISVHNMPRITSAINYADSIVCISECLRDKCIQEYNSDPNKIVLIPDGIDMNLFYKKDWNKIKEIINPKFNREYKLLSVGRIAPQKNLENLLKSIYYIKSFLGDVVHIHLGVGDEVSMRQIVNLRDSLGLKGVSYFLGGKPKEELPFYYSWADIHLFPSIYEGLGRVSVESLACGTPTITTNYAPMSEVVIEGLNGLLVNPLDPEDIATKTNEFFKNNSLRKTLEKNSRKSVIKKYNVNYAMQKHCENYENLLGD